MPPVLNNPFAYSPSPLMLQVVARVMGRLPRYATNQGMEGKMLGVLIVEWQGRMGYLMAYSGQVAAEKLAQWGVAEDEWVPMVMDYLQPDGYFKTHEAEISQLNHDIERLLKSEEYLSAKSSLLSLTAQAEQDTDRQRQTIREAKARRDLRRSQGGLTHEEEEAMVRESQYLKAELHRTKLKWRKALGEANQKLQELQETIDAKKRKRRLMSDRLQGWLFSHFTFRCADGTDVSLLDIFSPQTPPSGAGECCEPKLLDYALRHDMRPREMAMFWWGDPPVAEVRRHGSFYPACRGKCRPILTRMLRGLDVAAEEPTGCHEPLRIVYEDEWLAVVSKPAGMLSVPGKLRQTSVEELMRHRWKVSQGVPLMPHRLDMATSGLMLVARDADTYKALQRQFADHTISKTYRALIAASTASTLPDEGTISLPLRPDIDDRPRQLVDHRYGREAITYYKKTGLTLTTTDGTEAAELELRPLTGRTHQLRVHCAHAAGLNAPIVGDPLYGSGGPRLCLHAYSLRFRHSHTGLQMQFSDPTPW